MSTSISIDVERVIAVRVERVNKVFNAGQPNEVDALIDIDLSVASGEIVSLIGLT